MLHRWYWRWKLIEPIWTTVAFVLCAFLIFYSVYGAHAVALFVMRARLRHNSFASVMAVLAISWHDYQLLSKFGDVCSREDNTCFLPLRQCRYEWQFLQLQQWCLLLCEVFKTTNLTWTFAENQSSDYITDALRRLSGTHFLRLSSEATHCLYSNLG